MDDGPLHVIICMREAWEQYTRYGIGPCYRLSMNGCSGRISPVRHCEAFTEA